MGALQLRSQSLITPDIADVTDVNQQPASGPSPGSISPLPGIAGRAGEWGSVELVLSCPFPDAPAEVPYLKIMRRELTPELVKRVAEEVFGFTGEIREYEGGLRIDNGRRRLEVFSSGSLMFADLDRPPIVHPREEEARAVAEKTLEKARAYWLVPRNPDVTVTLRSVSIGHSGADYKPTEDGFVLLEKYVYTISVIYDLKFRDLVIRGIGIGIEVGENGQLKKFTSFWGDVEVDGNVTIVTPMEAFERLMSGTGLVLPRGPIEGVIVKSIDLGYDRGPVDERRNYLMPVYLFRSVLLREGREEFPATFVVPAGVEKNRTTPAVPIGDNRPVGPGFYVSVSPREQSGPPGATLVYTLSVANFGDIPDTFDLAVKSDKGWASALEVASITVTARQGREVRFSVTIPKDMWLGYWDTITITAVSRTDPMKTAYILCLAKSEVAGPSPENLAENTV